MIKPSYHVKVYSVEWGWRATASTNGSIYASDIVTSAFGFTNKQALRRLNKKLDRLNERPGHPLMQDTEKDYSEEKDEKPATNIFDQKGNEIPELARWLKAYYKNIFPDSEPLVARTLAGFNVRSAGLGGEVSWTLSLQEAREMKTAHDNNLQQRAENDMAGKLDSYFVTLFPTEGVGVFRLPDDGYRVEIGEGMIVELNDDSAEALVASTDDFPDANDPDLAEKVTAFTTNTIPKDEPTEDTRRQLTDVTVEELFEEGGLLDKFLDDRQFRRNKAAFELQMEIGRRGLYRQ